jgi:hypothetical protein
LADREAPPQWIVRIASWFKGKVMAAARYGRKKRDLNA